MRVQAFIDRMQYKLEGRDDLSASILAEMDYCQEAIMESNQWLPWFLESEVAFSATSPGDSRILLPEDFLCEMEEAFLYIRKEDGVIRPLKKMDYDVSFPRFSRANGFPLHYSLVGEYFYLFPSPDDAYHISMLYYARDRRPSEIGFDEENLWLKHAAGLFFSVVGKEMASKVIQNDGLAASFAADVPAEWQKLYNRHTAIKETNHDRG